MALVMHSQRALTSCIMQVALLSLLSTCRWLPWMPGYMQRGVIACVRDEGHLEELCQQHNVTLASCNVRRCVALEVLCTGVRSVPVSPICPQRELQAHCNFLHFLQQQRGTKVLTGAIQEVHIGRKE